MMSAVYSVSYPLNNRIFNRAKIQRFFDITKSDMIFLTYINFHFGIPIPDTQSFYFP